MREWRDEKNPERSGNALHKASGVNTSYLSTMHNGGLVQKHKDPKKEPTVIADSYWYAVAKAIGYDLYREIHFEQNESYQAVQQVCEYARNTRRRVLLDGPSGTGKTYGLERFTRLTNQAEGRDVVLYVKCTSMMNGRDLINLLHQKLKLERGARSQSGKLQEIADKLLSTGYLIIFDELESVSPAIHRVIKDVEDATYRRVGIVACGAGLEAELEAGARKGKKLMPQLLRRFGSNRKKLLAFKHVLDEQQRELFGHRIVEAACKEYGILDKDVVEYMKDRVQNMAQLNEWVADITELLMQRGLPVNLKNVKSLMSL